VNNNLLEITLQQLSALSPEKKLVILHPADWQNHRRVMDAFLSAGQAVYFHLTPQTATLLTFFSALQTALEEQAGIEMKSSAKSAKKLAQVVADTLNTTPPLTLLVEGYDQVNDPDLDQFMIALGESLPDGRRVVLISRHLPRGILFNHPPPSAAILPSAPERLLVDYAAPLDGQSILEVRALGAGQALINGRRMEQWDGVLPKCLFYFLVDQAMTTRTEIFETFWPTLEKREATNVFHVTKRKVSEILGQDLTTYASTFYRIADNIRLYYDVVLFQEAVQNAEIAENDNEAIAFYQEAIRLYRGPFLSTLDQAWVVERRQELQLTYTEALIGVAQIYRQRGRLAEALGLYARAAANMPQREDLARILMEIYRDQHRPALALEVYDRLARVLRAELNLTPSPEILTLVEEIRKML
jgi:DNA-binding SARP family transcriptional activator